jgi:hypothetical protein
MSRPEALQVALLERQWARAVTTVASSPAATGEDDEEFAARLQDVLEDVTQVQSRADACPGRWARPGGPADRRVLDHVCLMALAGVSTEVDLDIRSVALATGIGRETARTALRRLTIDSWLSQISPSVGPLAATWGLNRGPSGQGNGPVQGPEDVQEPLVINPHPPLSTGALDMPRSHVVPPPGGGWDPPDNPPRSATQLLSDRAAWSARLSYRLSAQVHDVFVGTARGLGHHAASVFAALEAGGDAEGGWMSHSDLAARTGRRSEKLVGLLRLLAAHRLARTGPALPGQVGPAWCAGSRRHRASAARSRGVDGVLAARARAVAVDRAVWAWWLAELDWMHTPARQRPERARRGRRAGPGQLALPLPGAVTARHRYGPYPRHPGRGGASGRADHTAARDAVQSARAAAA